VNAKRLVFIDHIRGLAILGVFLFHGLTGADKLFFSGWTRDFSELYRVLLSPLNLGWLGVASFFVVSGFCIHVSFQQQGQNWRGFFLRRFFRLVPPYLVALLFFALVLPFSRLRFGSDDLAGLNLFNHIFLVHNLNHKTVWGINSSLWTIGVEVQLYLLYPILIYVARAYGWRMSLWLAGICEVTICLSKVLVPSSSHGLFGMAKPVLESFAQLGHTPLAFWLSWALGAGLAECYLQNKSSRLVKMPVSVSVAFVLMCFLVRSLSPFIFLAAAFATANVMARLLETERNGSLRIPDWLEPMRQLGIYSYSLYLLHQPLMYAITNNLTNVLQLQNRPFIHYLISISTLLFIFPISFLFYRYLEQPSIGLGKRVIRNLENRSCANPATLTDTGKQRP
jgi:peptidoglycan/LPS O-acetylase OafA/YrhL